MLFCIRMDECLCPTDECGPGDGRPAEPLRGGEGRETGGEGRREGGGGEGRRGVGMGGEGRREGRGGRVL